MLKLKEIRKEKKYTQEDMAQKLNLQKQTYQNYELGKREPTIETIMKIATILETSIDKLFGIEKKEDSLTPEKASLLKTIESLNEIECHKLNVFAQGLIMNRNFEQKERTLKIIKNIEEDN